jgi:DNA-binding NarL/FixJ family response regulator
VDGIEATRRIAKAAGGGPRMLMLTTFDLDDYVFGAFAAGASGFLVKDAPREQILEGIGPWPRARRSPPRPSLDG